MRNDTLVLVSMFAFTLGGFAFAQPSSNLPGQRMTPSQKQAIESYGADVQIAFGGGDVPRSIVGQLSTRLYPTDAAAEAKAALDRNGAAFRRGSDDGFTLSAIEPDGEGMLHVRMAQTYQGIPVAGGELTVHLSDHEVTGISGHFVPDLRVQTGSAGANRTAAAIFVDKQGVGHLTVPTHSAEEGADLFVDAQSGKVLGKETASSGPAPIKVPPSTNHLLNPGFESGTANWTGQTFEKGLYTAPSYYKPQPPVCLGTTYPLSHTGLNWACMNGHGTANTEIVAQTVTVPSDATSGTLSFWLHIRTLEDPEVYPYIHDTLTIQVNGATLAVFSNLNQYNYSSYRQVSLPFPSGFRGQTVQVRFVGTEDGGQPTWFDIDDTSLTFAGLVSGIGN